MIKTVKNRIFCLSFILSFIITTPLLNAQSVTIRNVLVHNDSLIIKAKNKIPKSKFRIKHKKSRWVNRADLINKNPDSLISPWIADYKQWKVMPKYLK